MIDFDYNRNILDTKIDQWGLDRGIIQNGLPLAQVSKTLEETAELVAALTTDNKEEVMDALGDIYVTLRMVAGTYGVPLEKCIRMAYEEIKDRKGYLREDGVFVKDAEGQSYMDFEDVSYE